MSGEKSMEDASHSVAHFMAVGAEKRLEDYHFLRNTYETITSQEIQLNRILRMLGEDEFTLTWRLDLPPVGRARSRSPLNFDRWANSMVLKGSIAYERLRELEQDTSRSGKPVTIPSTSRRVQEMRERRQRLSEQRELPSASSAGVRSTSSSSRLQALAEYETALAESNTKRQRQAEQTRSNNLRNDEVDAPERKRERFTTAADDDRSYGRSKQYDDESSKRSTRKTSIEDDLSRKVGKDRENESDKLRKSSMGSKPEKAADIELISFTVRYQIMPSSNSNEEGEENNPSVRLFCRWASPSSSSAIEYFTIERQSGDNQWSPIGGQIDKLENQTKLDIALSNDDTDGGINANVPYYFRLKAHLQNGQTFTSKSTDGILIDLSREKKIITPDVEILSPTSVQLTWNDTANETNENEDGANENKSDQLYDIEKKEEEQPEWEKVTEVPLSQQSAKIDSLTDAAQYQFRLIPTIPEPEENTKPSAETSSNQDVDFEEPTSPKTTKPSAATTKQTESDESDILNATKSAAPSSSKKDIKADEPADSDELDTTNAQKSVTPSKKQAESDESKVRSGRSSIASAQEQADSDELDTTNAQKSVTPSKKQADSDESKARSGRSSIASAQEQADSEELDTTNAQKSVTPSKQQADSDESKARSGRNSIASADEQVESDELDVTDTKPSVAPSTKKQVESDESNKFNARNAPSSSDNEIEVEETAEAENGEEQEEQEEEAEVVTVNNVNDWLNSLHVAPTSSSTVDVDISEEGFEKFDCYKIEYTTSDRPDRWRQASDITRDDPHLTIDSLKQGTDYKFRFTPVASDTTSATDGTNSSQFSLILDVHMPSARKGRFASDDTETPAATPPQFSIQKVDPTTVLIEAVVPEDEPATFKDTYEVYSKKDVDEDEDWAKVGTIDNEHLSTTVEDLEENTAYAFKIDNITSPSTDEESHTVQEFKFNTTPAKKYDPSLLLEKIEQSLENVVNGVMQAAAGHQAIEEPVNQSLNEVIKEVFRDESLPNEQYGFDTLALNNDLQVYRGPKQMMIKDLEVDETVDLSKHYGEIIIHNYRTSQQSVIVREENGNTRVNNIDGDIIIRNVVSDVILKNEQTHHQLSMNIVGQAFLKGVQGSLIASKFKGIIVVKNVHKP